MKKLIIALAVAAMAAGVQAAAWTWGMSTSGPIEKPGTEIDLSSGTAYLFADLTSAQLNAIVSDFAAGTYAATGYEQTSAIADGLVTKISFDDSRTAGTTVNWTMLVTTKIDGDDYLFISGALAKTRQADGKNTKITFSLYDDSSAAATEASQGYGGAGWYSAPSAIPEPTTGLLVLLGVAGLALRRRRA